LPESCIFAVLHAFLLYKNTPKGVDVRNTQVSIVAFFDGANETMNNLFPNVNAEAFNRLYQFIRTAIPNIQQGTSPELTIQEVLLNADFDSGSSNVDYWQNIAIRVAVVSGVLALDRDMRTLASTILHPATQWNSNG
jgi:hypothetical protein